MLRFYCLFITLSLLVMGAEAQEKSLKGVGAQEIPYTSCTNCWNADSLGNQRMVVRFNGPGAVAHVVAPWRRRDGGVDAKRIIVQDGQTGRKVEKVGRGRLDKEVGELYWEAVSGKGEYYVYYLPYHNEGRSNYPKGMYWGADTVAGYGKGVAVNASVVRFEAVDTFNTRYPMEVAATEKEVGALREKHKGEAFLLFPEDREHSIRMEDELPYRWVARGLRSVLQGSADRGEFFTYQLGVYALRDLEDVRVTVGPLNSERGKVITGVCFNTGGVGYDGRVFEKKVGVRQGKVQALWCGVDVPKDAVPGMYSGVASVKAGGIERRVQVAITVGSRVAVGDAPEKMGRLKWLNSTLAQENTVVAPYTPLRIEGDTMVYLLGRRVQLNGQGFPEQITTFFTPEMTEVGTQPNNLLAENIHFHFTKLSDGKDIRLKNGGVVYTERSAGTVSWKASSTAAELQMDVTGRLEFDGFLKFTVAVVALQDLDFKDIVMHIPFQKEAARYWMGFGQKGGERPDSMYHWKWDVAHKNQDGGWIGAVNAGLQYSLRDERYVRPLNTNFYLQKPLVEPLSWANGGKGGMDIGIKGRSMLANNYSGPRSMKKGDTLYYNFTLLITPFHTLNTDAQWATRFYHRYNSIDSIRATGATVVNIHHATPINPWINYPFIEWKRMKGYIDSAHEKGLKVKIYNTVRELSDRAYELFALRSLGDEIYSPGKGGGFSWLQEHVGDNYIPAWFVPEIKDAALINSGLSRWHNYYVEGMNWLVQNVGIDGIYLDDVAFDRTTMKRVKRVLTSDGHPGIIDLHSANQYNKNDGFNNSANLYMEHFPYLNRLWFGEYFDYEKGDPGFFLTEVSGIPFGLMGEMLEGGGNPWRGMIYGMTNRMPWTANADPRPIWKLWDEFGLQGTKMIGYWSPSCPVKTDRADVLATVYKKEGKVLVAVASWAPSDTTVKLVVDWKGLGLDSTKVKVVAPEVKNFQGGREFSLSEGIPVQKGKGWLLVMQ
ncbi:MAG: hypothetical protein JST68_13760 [Bacteroidetes bacterium]|nr:hypothetical protein [Bacteroidota bacterium]